LYRSKPTPEIGQNSIPGLRPIDFPDAIPSFKRAKHNRDLYVVQIRASPQIDAIQLEMVIYEIIALLKPVFFLAAPDLFDLMLDFGWYDDVGIISGASHWQPPS
jgi:hypothetical protein